MYSVHRMKVSRLASCRYQSQSAAPKVSILKSDSNDIFLNLATEEYIFHHLNPSTPTLFLWRNSPTVIIGKHQNPWTECHLSKMEADGIALARRYSGGGAVFQDLGNSCFTFLTSKETFDVDSNIGILTRALRRFNIEAEKSGRNDMVVNGRKISGSAFKKTHDRCLHHGTMLLNVDLGALENYLHPSKEKLKSKGIASVRSRVMNLTELNAAISHAEWMQAMAREFCAHHGEDAANVKFEDVGEIRKDEKFGQYYERLVDWAWRYGKTPEWDCHWTRRFDWGELVCGVNYHDHHRDIKIYSDNLVPLLIESLMQHLKGVPLTADGIKSACQTVIEEFASSPEVQANIADFSEWLVQVIQRDVAAEAEKTSRE